MMKWFKWTKILLIIRLWEIIVTKKKEELWINLFGPADENEIGMYSGGHIK